MQTLREKIENIRFILLDMDGTMFNAAHRIDAETADVMRQLMDKGYYVAAATGRGLATLQPLLNPLGLRFNAPSVGSAGGEVGEAGCVGSERLFTHAFPREELLQLLRFVLSVGANFCTDGIGRVFVSEAAGTDTYQFKDSRIAKEMGCAYPEVVQLHTETLEQQLGEGEVFKILIWHENDAQRDAIFDFLAAHPGIHGFSTARTMMEALPTGVDKAAGVQIAAEKLGLTPAQCCVFGDSGNDVAMLKAAGLSVAMKNASDDVLAVADLVTDYPNSEFGAARMLQKLFLSEE